MGVCSAAWLGSVFRQLCDYCCSPGHWPRANQVPYTNNQTYIDLWRGTHFSLAWLVADGNLSEFKWEFSCWIMERGRRCRAVLYRPVHLGLGVSFFERVLFTRIVYVNVWMGYSVTAQKDTLDIWTISLHLCDMYPLDGAHQFSPRSGPCLSKYVLYIWGYCSHRLSWLDTGKTLFVIYVAQLGTSLKLMRFVTRALLLISMELIR